MFGKGNLVIKSELSWERWWILAAIYGWTDPRLSDALHEFDRQFGKPVKGLAYPGAPPKRHVPSLSDDDNVPVPITPAQPDKPKRKKKKKKKNQRIIGNDSLATADMATFGGHLAALPSDIVGDAASAASHETEFQLLEGRFTFDDRQAWGFPYASSNSTKKFTYVPTGSPGSYPIASSYTKPGHTNAYHPSSVHNPAPKSDTGSAADRFGKLALDLVTEPAVEPITEPAVETITDLAANYVTESAAKHVTEPAVEPVADKNLQNPVESIQTATVIKEGKKTNDNPNEGV
ncbi:hypothetical protein BGZ61DRAFT_477382 [Ilyonectria robusta]|uniref:uncharacterized protein n=1 Tax=Ilyonectria robusta TaxID=1079257 RepID=UPI001E8D756B|nr:uncharacterized protein BGZ61DRAFT_477382 [Ilyonectria robusta]KAH8706773.1 hypothetical protein BGZ61DRAFT_477382 [Ilyonectria robusta]